MPVTNAYTNNTYTHDYMWLPNTYTVTYNTNPTIVYNGVTAQGFGTHHYRVNPVTTTGYYELFDMDADDEEYGIDEEAWLEVMRPDS